MPSEELYSHNSEELYPPQTLIHHFLEFRPSLQMGLSRCLSHSLEQALILGHVREDLLQQAQQNWRDTVGSRITKVFFNALAQELAQADLEVTAHSPSQPMKSPGKPRS